VRRAFAAGRPDEVGLTDITEHGTGTRKVYVCAVQVVCSRRIDGRSIGRGLTSKPTKTALRLTLAPAPNSGHRNRSLGLGKAVAVSPRPTHASRSQASRNHGRSESATDDTAMESFYPLLKKNLLNRQSWTDRYELRNLMIIWTEAAYNHRRDSAHTTGSPPLSSEASSDNQHL
jgi:transposase InsO family protein